MLVEVRVPKLGSAGWSYTKMTCRAGLGDGRGCRVVHGNGSIERASVGLTNMGATPLRARATEEALEGGASIEDAAALAAEGTDPPLGPRRELGLPPPPGTRPPRGARSRRRSC